MELEFAPMPEPPPGQTWWHAEIDIDGEVSAVPLFACVDQVGAFQLPTGVELRAQRIAQGLTKYLELARAFLAEAILSSPEALGSNDVMAAPLRTAESESFPFDLPEITVYDENEWMIRFAEGRCSNAFLSFGLAVVFHGDEAVSAEDLSDSDNIDS